ncbi:helix-turn-helix domain-containing protein [Streptomyces sp. NPDC048290]|uniref:winged helix-turn-helix transcriptional regulator n=1 Tax=Streptomyces sp. NPDC048290 TaxID=3155811 RepID=UPI00341D0BBE
MSPRRSYDQYCSAARALDVVGDRWTLLIVRELLAGPRRYTDLHADLPGVSTDVLASRLKDMERDGLTTRRRLPPPAAAFVYELTPRGARLLPVLQALGEWGEDELGDRRPTDALRAHWLALPLLRALAGREGEGLVQVRTEEGDFHVRVGGGADAGPLYGDGDGSASGEQPAARLEFDRDTGTALARGLVTLTDAVRDGRVSVSGDSTLAKALREA